VKKIGRGRAERRRDRKKPRASFSGRQRRRERLPDWGGGGFGARPAASSSCVGLDTPSCSSRDAWGGSRAPPPGRARVNDLPSLPCPHSSLTLRPSRPRTPGSPPPARPGLGGEEGWIAAWPTPCLTGAARAVRGGCEAREKRGVKGKRTRNALTFRSLTTRRPLCSFAVRHFSRLLDGLPQTSLSTSHTMTHGTTVMSVLDCRPFRAGAPCTGGDLKMQFGCAAPLPWPPSRRVRPHAAHPGQARAFWSTSHRPVMSLCLALLRRIESARRRETEGYTVVGVSHLSSHKPHKPPPLLSPPPSSPPPPPPSPSV